MAEHLPWKPVIYDAGVFSINNGGTFIDGSGMVTICGTWNNNSDFVKILIVRLGLILKIPSMTLPLGSETPTETVLPMIKTFFLLILPWLWIATVME
jgi:hypothetical protein